MKKVLVTGAFGSVGKCVIKFLLSEGKYEITALDLNTKKNNKLSKKYKNRINVVLGDINDSTLIENLVKEKDTIIHLVSVMPPFSDFSKSLVELVEYDGTENIIKAINYYNPSCYLIYGSTTSLYDASLSGCIDEKVKENELNTFSYYKYVTELLIKKKLRNYTILRLPLVLNNIINESFIFNIKSNSLIEVTTNYDAAYAFVSSIENMKLLNKKIFNVGMGIKGRLLYKEILINILKYQGISFRYILSRLFLDKNYYSPVLTDSDNLDDLIHYRHDNLKLYYDRLRRVGRKRKIRKILAKPFIYFMNKKG